MAVDTYISQWRKSTARPYPHQQEVEKQYRRQRMVHSASTVYNNIIQAYREAAELHVPSKPTTKKKSVWECKKVVGKTGALQDVLKGTNEEVRPKASKLEDAKKDLDRA